MVKQVKVFLDYINDVDLDYFVDVMIGQVKFVICCDYGVLFIERYEDFMFLIDNYYGCKKFEGIKCLFFLGSINGDIVL